MLCFFATALFPAELLIWVWSWNTYDKIRAFYSLLYLLNGIFFIFFPFEVFSSFIDTIYT